MVCSKCGNQIMEGTKFCTKCGAPVEEAPAAPIYQAPAEPVYQAAPAYEAAPQPAKEPKLAAVKSPVWKMVFIALIATAGAITLDMFVQLFAYETFSLFSGSVYNYVIALIIPAILFLYINGNLRINSTKPLLIGTLAVVGIQLTAALLCFILYIAEADASLFSWINGSMVLADLPLMFDDWGGFRFFIYMMIDAAFIAKNVFCLFGLLKLAKN